MRAKVDGRRRPNFRADWSDAAQRRLIRAWNEGLPKVAIRTRWGIGPGRAIWDLLGRISADLGIPLTRHVVLRGRQPITNPDRARRAATSFRRSVERTTLAPNQVTPLLGARRSPHPSEVTITLTQERTYSRNPTAVIGQAIRRALKAPGEVVTYDAAGHVLKTQSPSEFKTEQWAKTLERRRARAELNRN